MKIGKSSSFQDPTPSGSPSTTVVPQWQLDLDRAGFLRRALLARKWYGGDWWFVVLSGILLLFVITVGIFPQWFAPYDPRAEVGPSLLAPNEPPAAFVMILPAASTVDEIREIASSTNNIGFVVGSPASQALREVIDKLNEEEEAQGTGVRYQPRPRRFDTVEEGIQALNAGEIDAFLESSAVAETIVGASSSLKISSVMREASERGFALGTNQIGQDVLSRLIWGTRIALIVGLSSALISIVIGVPLGLISAFTGGWLDRTLTLIMDALYSFPGLILAIAIAAVLGPGIGNIIFAIAVLYIPTYFRIVRGQVLQIREEMYVDAAKSLGAKPRTILWKYIFPNVIPSVVIIFSVNVADAILTEAGLSFIGLGLPPDTPDWGIDLARGQDYLRRAWWLITFPGLMVTMVTLAFSMLGESLSEIMNPRLAEL
jgi:peptide/nickel transport system permease protein